MSAKPVHVYIRQRNGRIITHGYWPAQEVSKVVAAARAAGIPRRHAIQWALDCAYARAKEVLA